ncbi:MULTISPECIES: ankyrin repeat domain-containing protein [Streptomyces]|uniref:Ankyrin repeat domain-containing protein n=2 Tax=Streptomyces TaxID=1883 RepID=A0A939FMT7_9ACTN|nr:MULTISPECIES: ankyrin repeat domain-containing protein [Streptomyces]MBO0653614.1 ankyrin repeat domain-containing protein [Streptomyces triculaminicus]QSY48436.1 ankyrin repeat domain-containing protein [Streptomyces griseocarneus]
MTGPRPETEEPAHDPEVLQLAAKVFDLARHGDTATLAAYVDAGVPANLTNDRGDSLVMLAAYHGHIDAVIALLERGADPDRPNDRGQTPLAGAVFKGETEVVRVLVAHGADPAAGMPSALDTAAMFARQDLLELLQGE